jgi:hypothetical protein
VQPRQLSSSAARAAASPFRRSHAVGIVRLGANCPDPNEDRNRSISLKKIDRAAVARRGKKLAARARPRAARRDFAAAQRLACYAAGEELLNL